MTAPSTREGLGSRGTVLLLMAVVVLTPASSAATTGPSFFSTVQLAPATNSVTVDISATPSLSFTPDSFTVAPGDSVHVVVTQLANFLHTFTLVDAVNQTIPSGDTPAEMYAFLHQHGVIANLSLGSTPGDEFYANFTAPLTTGTYEFLCEVHFPAMAGTMTDSTSSGGSSGGPASLSSQELAAVGVVVAVVVIVGAVLAVRRRRPPKTSAANASAPGTSPGQPPN